MKKAIILCLALSCAIAFDLMTGTSYPWHRASMEILLFIIYIARKI